MRVSTGAIANDKISEFPQVFVDNGCASNNLMNLARSKMVIYIGRGQAKCHQVS